MSATTFSTDVSLVGTYEGLNLSYNQGANLNYRPQFDAQGKVVKGKGAWDQFNAAMRHQYPADQADSVVISANQLTFLEKNIKSILRKKAVSENTFPTRYVGAGVTKVTGQTNGDIPNPRATKTLDGGRSTNVQWADTSYNLLGLDYDIYLDKITVDAGNNPEGKMVVYTPNPQQNQINAFTESLVESVEWFKWHGSESPALIQAPSGYKGILNTTGITDPGAMGIGADDDVADVGDVYDSCISMAKSLLDLNFAPPYDIYMTNGVAAAGLQSIGTSDRTKSDIHLLNDLIAFNGQGKMFNSINVAPFLCQYETETSGTGAIAVIAPRPDENYIASSYPVGIYPMNVQGLGWGVKLFWYGGSVIDRAEAICFANNLTTV